MIKYELLLNMLKCELNCNIRKLNFIWMGIWWTCIEMRLTQDFRKWSIYGARRAYIIPAGGQGPATYKALPPPWVCLCSRKTAPGLILPRQKRAMVWISKRKKKDFRTGINAGPKGLTPFQGLGSLNMLKAPKSKFFTFLLIQRHDFFLTQLLTSEKLRNNFLTPSNTLNLQQDLTVA